jgi:hypothetical protein
MVHLVNFMKITHDAFLHATRMYHSPHAMEYWSNKHGRECFANLFRDMQAGENPVTTYQRMSSLSQAQFNDKMFGNTLAKRSTFKTA